MAKKKGKSGNKAAASTETSSPSTPAPEVDNSPTVAAEASDAPSPEPSSAEVVAPSPDAQPEAAPHSAASSSDSAIEELRRELDAAKSQIAELQSKNAALAAENERLKVTHATAPVPKVDAGRQADLEALTQRIASLKAEQAEADAAREAAWSQLKSVVADIARLAAPDAVLKAVGTPTAASAAGFGAA